MIQLFDTELFETNSISIQSIQELHRQNSWIKSYNELKGRSRFKRMNQICTLILETVFSRNDLNGNQKNTFHLIRILPLHVLEL